ncbi:tau-tubulin kinase 1 [Plakobranchus ocellatus]|uniref:Tau-tubulin kinase 1 n=1 Tax=Plakobranchus ocellatus TaxID=259542 RepID=A0AAV4AXK6_9GAST|nr:tau-tubulin kinase 1 [Plakobranchus ocellatus]
MGPITPGHGATEVLDENLSYQEGEEQLKKPELIPLNEVDNRYVEEGVVVLSRPDADTPPAKYEQDTKAKEKSKDQEKVVCTGVEKQDTGQHRKVANIDIASSKDLGNRSGAANTSFVKQQGHGNVRGGGAGPTPAPESAVGFHAGSKTRGEKEYISPGDRLPPPGPSVGQGLPTMGVNPVGMGLTAGMLGRTRLVRLHEGPESSGVDFVNNEKVASASGNIAGGFLPPSSNAVALEAGEPSNENENMRLESQPDLASRAAITFALMQTDDKTHTQCDEGAEENATRAAPFTMASQWGVLGSSDEGSDNEDSENDDGGGDKGRKSARSRRRMMNTLADEDDHQLDSMARNSLVLLDERDGHETMRASLVFEEDNGVLSTAREDAGREEGAETLGRHADSAHPFAHHASQDRSYSSPRKMPEKLAKDIDNRIGSPLKQSSGGSPSKIVFKNREQSEDKRNKKLVALGKPPIHSSGKREKSLDVPNWGASDGSKPPSGAHLSRDPAATTAKPKSILKDKNSGMSGERNTNVDNRFSSEASEGASNGRVLVTMKDEPNSTTPREQSPRRLSASRASFPRGKDSDNASGQHIRRYSRSGPLASPRGLIDPRSLSTPDSESAPVPKPPPGQAPKNPVVTARRRRYKLASSSVSPREANSP